ncbi:MAG TPA: PAS domain S-box protein [Bacteroidota bacterium]
MSTKTRILILEDNPADVELMKAELQKAKIEYEATVVSAQQPFEQALKKFQPDVILSDYALPQFDGIAAMRIALRAAPSVPFIFVTGSMNEETAVECMKAGAADYVLKQRLARLGQAVKNALERKRANEDKDRAERALRTSEELFRSLVENISEIFYVVDMRGKIAYGSPNLFASTGYAPEELLGNSYTRLVCEEDRHRVVEFYKQYTDDGTVDTVLEFRAQPKRGRPIWGEQATRIIRDHSGAVVEYRNIVRNITDRKLAQEALAESERLLTQAQRVASLGHYVFDVATGSWTSSEVLDEIFGIDAQYTKNVEGWLAIVHPEQRADMAAYLANHVIKSGRAFDKEYHIVRINDGVERWVLGLGNLEFNAKGQVVKMFGIIQDITGRKKAEEARRESEERYSSLFENMINGFAYCRMVFENDKPQDFVYLAVNKSFETLTGLKNVVGKQVSEVIPGIRESDPALFEMYGRVARGGAPVRFETYVQALQMWFDISVFSPLKDHFVAVFDVVTERKRAEEALRESEAKLKNIVESSTNMFYTHDVNHVLQYVSPQVHDLLGYSVEESLTRWTEFASDNPLNEAGYQKTIQAIQSGKQQAPYELELVHKSGKKVWVEVREAPVVKDGVTVAIVGSLTDITERKKAEEALRLAEAKYHAIFENAMNGIFQTSPDGHFLMVNPAMARMLGYSSPEELINSRTDITHQGYVDPKRREAFKQLIERQGYVVGFEYEVYRKDGSTMWISENARPVRDALGALLYYEGFFEDITERKRAAQARLESEARFRELFDDAPIGYHEIDSKGTITRVNMTECEMLGYTPEEMVGRPAWEFSQDRDLSRRAIHNKFATKGPLKPFERTFVRKDGSLLAVSVQDRYLIDEAGTIVGIRTTIQDITERKRTEEEVLRQTAYFRQLFASSPSAIVLLDTDDHVLDINQAFTNIFLYTLDEVKKRPLNDFIVPPEGRKEAEQFTDQRKRGEVVQKELVRRKKDGGLVDVALTAYPIVMEGKQAGVFAIYVDISERKKAERELLQQTSYFRQLFDSSPAAIVLVDMNDHVIDINRAFTDLFQFTIDEIKGCSLNDFIAPDDRKHEAEELSMDSRQGKAVQQETVRKRKNGEAVEVAITGYPIVIDTKTVGVYAIYVDISGRKRLEEQLRQSQKLESLGTLAGGIAHDFNNILGIILGHITLLERMPSDPAKITSSTEAIARASHRGAALVRQLLTFARKAEAQFEQMRVNDVVKEVQKLLRETFPKIIVVTLELDEKLPPIIADATQVHQVLINLCVNARDALLPQGGTLSVKTRRIGGSFVRQRYQDADAPEYLLLSVSDTGAGRDEVTRTRIFEPFFTTKELGKGTGLGLATVYGIMQSHHGFIDLETAPGRGTTFHIYFPMQVAPEKMQEQPSETLEEAVGGTETILLIEDEDMLRELASMILQAKGYTVLTARDGEEGLVMFKKHKDAIHLVLSDMGLPKMGGLEMFQFIKKVRPDVRAVFASGFIEPELRSEIFKAGVKDFIQKPFIPAVLLKRIRHVLNDNPDIPPKQ